MILVRMGNHEIFKFEGPRKPPKAPAQKAVHIIRFACINDQGLVIRGLDMGTITLPHIDKIDFQYAICLEVFLTHPTGSSA